MKVHRSCKYCSRSFMVDFGYWPLGPWPSAPAGGPRNGLGFWSSSKPFIKVLTILNGPSSNRNVRSKHARKDSRLSSLNKYCLFANIRKAQKHNFVHFPSRFVWRPRCLAQMCYDRLACDLTLSSSMTDFYGRGRMAYGFDVNIWSIHSWSVSI